MPGMQTPVPRCGVPPKYIPGEAFAISTHLTGYSLNYIFFFQKLVDKPSNPEQRCWNPGGAQASRFPLLPLPPVVLFSLCTDSKLEFGVRGTNCKHVDQRKSDFVTFVK